MDYGGWVGFTMQKQGEAITGSRRIIRKESGKIKLPNSPEPRGIRTEEYAKTTPWKVEVFVDSLVQFCFVF